MGTVRCASNRITLTLFLALVACITGTPRAHALQCVKIINNFTPTTVEWYHLGIPNHFRFVINRIERSVTPWVDEGSKPVQTDQIARGDSKIVCRHSVFQVSAAIVRFNGMSKLNANLIKTINIGIGAACGECSDFLALLEPWIKLGKAGFKSGEVAEFRSDINDGDIAYVGVPGQYRALTISGGPLIGYTAGIDNVPVLKGKGLVDPPSPMYHNEEGKIDLANYKITANSYHPGIPAYILENTTVQGCAALCKNNVLKLAGRSGKCVGFNYYLTAIGRNKIFTCSLFAKTANSVCGTQRANVRKAQIVHYYESRSARFVPKPKSCSRTSGE